MSDSCEARKREGGTVLLAGSRAARHYYYDDPASKYLPLLQSQKKQTFRSRSLERKKVHFLHIFDSHLATGESPELIFELSLLLTTREM